MVLKRTSSKKTNSQKAKTKQHSAAETVIEGQLAAAPALDRLRQISPVTWVLICAVILTLGLSLWPHLAPLFIPSSDDRWQADMEIRISQLSTDMQMLSDQQAALTGELQAVQDNLSDLDHQIKNTASSVVQFSDALIKDIERIDSQSALVAEKLAALNSFSSEQEKSAQQADSMASSDTQPKADSLLQHLPELAVPNLSLPSISGWWQGVSEWFGSLVSVERVQPDQEQQ